MFDFQMMLTLYLASWFHAHVLYIDILTVYSIQLKYFKKIFCLDICKDDDYDGDDEKRTGSLNSGMYIMYTLDKKIRNSSTVYCR